MAKTEPDIKLYHGNSLLLCEEWETPTVIICDGPYGVNGFPGDLRTEDGLAEWYEPHIKKWTEKSTPRTTLWFWCTEQGWAEVHPVFLKHGWEFKGCHVWDKGLSHVAGNVNTKTISHLPIVTEVCVQYVLKPYFKVNGQKLSMMDWLRYEWKRTGLTWNKANEACGVKDAAVRKYFTNEKYLWYMPPTNKFRMIVDYANEHGKKETAPYFSVDGINPLSEIEWDMLKPVFNCPIGVTNVWSIPQLRDTERIKNKNKALHLNQKPLQLIERTIAITSNPGDVVWDVFGGLFTTAVACINLGRKCYTAEIRKEVFDEGKKRVMNKQKELIIPSTNQK